MNNKWIVAFYAELRFAKYPSNFELVTLLNQNAIYGGKRICFVYTQLAYPRLCRR